MKIADMIARLEARGYVVAAPPAELVGDEVPMEALDRLEAEGFTVHRPGRVRTFTNAVPTERVNL